MPIIIIPPEVNWLRQDLQLALACARKNGSDVNSLKNLDSERRFRIIHHWDVLSEWAKDQQITEDDLFQLVSANFQTFGLEDSLLPVARELMN